MEDAQHEGPSRPPALACASGSSGSNTGRGWAQQRSLPDSFMSAASSSLGGDGDSYSLGTPASPLERFDFVAVIGAGSFGSVYLAKDRCPPPPPPLPPSSHRSGSGSGSGSVGEGWEEGEEEEEGEELEGMRRVAIKVVDLEEQEDEMEEIQRVGFVFLCNWLND